MITKDWTVSQNQKVNITSAHQQSPIIGIGGINGTPFYLNFPQLSALYQWVFPQIYGFFFPLTAPLDVLTVDASTFPANSQAPPSGSTAQAQLTAWYYDPTDNQLPAYTPGTPAVTTTVQRWTIIGAPAVGAQATATRAASPNVTHVGDSFVASMFQTATTSGSTTLKVEDGAAGSAAKWLSLVCGCGAVAGNQWGPLAQGPGLTWRGTPGNAMTIEMAGALTGISEAVSLSGFDQ